MRRPSSKPATISRQLPRMNYVVGMLLLSGLAITAVGCAKFDLRRNIPWQETSDKPVRSVVAFWTEAVIERTSGPPYRGFGGRLLFYPADMSHPVKVQGTVVVYAFDEDLPPPENLKPVRKFVFTNEQLQQVYSESKLGPSYNLLIPWEEFSPKSRRVSLIVRFIPENGPSVVSEQVKVFLPGLDESMLAGNSRAASDRQPSPNSNSADPSLDAADGSRTAVTQWPISPTSYQESVKQAQPESRMQDKGVSSSSGVTTPEKKRRMETLTLNISPRLGNGVPSRLGHGDTSLSTGGNHEGAQSQQTSPVGHASPNTPGASASAQTQSQANLSSLNIQTPEQAYLTTVSAKIPRSPGELIADLNRQPPARFAPYRPLVPEGGVSQGLADRSPSAPSP